MAKQISWDDQDAAKRDDSFRGKKDKWDRFVVLDEQATMALTHYAPKVRYCECSMAMEGKCTWCERGDEPRERYGAIICLYNTNELGAPSTNPLSFKITWWPFGPDKFQVLRMAKLNFGDLRKHDIIVQCTEEQYQRMTLQAMPDAWWLKDKTFQAEVAKAYKEFSKTHDLMRKLARRIPYTEQAAAIAGNRDGDRGRDGNRDNRQGSGYQSRPDFNPTFAASAPPPASPASQPNPVPPSPPPAADAVDLDGLLNELK